MPKKDMSIIGTRFGRLTVISIDKHNSSKNTRYICHCDCGNEVSVSRPNLKNNTRSCGCLSKELHIKHGLGKHRISAIYRCMVRRCTNPNDNAYINYGGRGIKVCDEWLNDICAFYNWAINNGYDDSLTIDRINVDGNYEPSNCRWASRETQANNTRINNHVIYGDKVYTVSELARKLDVSRNTIYRYFDTEKPIKKDNLFLTGARNAYIPRKNDAEGVIL